MKTPDLVGPAGCRTYARSHTRCRTGCVGKALRAFLDKAGIWLRHYVVLHRLVNDVVRASLCSSRRPELLRARQLPPRAPDGGIVLTFQPPATPSQERHPPRWPTYAAPLPLHTLGRTLIVWRNPGEVGKCPALGASHVCAQHRRTCTRRARASLDPWVRVALPLAAAGASVWRKRLGVLPLAFCKEQFRETLLGS